MKILHTGNGYSVLLDDEDYEKVAAYNWTATKIGNNTYAVRCIWHGRHHKPKQTMILMHRELLGLNPGERLRPDHKDGNGLNNQRDNLRLATSPQNAANAPKNRTNSSRFKGVSYRASKRKWRAFIGVDGSAKHLGYFEREQDAALAYNAAASRLFGAFARLNAFS